MGVTAIGLNCGHEPSALMDNVRTLAACTALPFFVQPNASLPVVILTERRCFPPRRRTLRAICCRWSGWAPGRWAAAAVPRRSISPGW